MKLDLLSILFIVSAFVLLFALYDVVLPRAYLTLIQGRSSVLGETYFVRVSLRGKIYSGTVQEDRRSPAKGSDWDAVSVKAHKPKPSEGNSPGELVFHSALYKVLSAEARRRVRMICQVHFPALYTSLPPGTETHPGESHRPPHAISRADSNG